MHSLAVICGSPGLAVGSFAHPEAVGLQYGVGASDDATTSKTDPRNSQALANFNAHGTHRSDSIGPVRTRAPATGSRRLTEPPRSLWQISARRFGRNLPPLARTWQTLADITLLGSAKLTVPVDINRRTAQQLEASANPTTPTDMGDTMSDATNNSLRRRRSRATTCVALAAAATAAAALAVPRYRRNHRGI